MRQVPDSITELTDAQLQALLNLDKPRGTRNNNPGNIEDGPFARSLPGYAGTDGRFAVFDTPEAGIAAKDALLQRYGSQGLDTPAKIIGRYAPPNENDTAAYAAQVAQALGVGPNDRIDLNDPQTRQIVMAAIDRVENGGQAQEDDLGSLPDEELNLIAFGARGTQDDPIDLASLDPQSAALVKQGMWVRDPQGNVQQTTGDAIVGGDVSGSEEVSPGVYAARPNVGADVARSAFSGVQSGLAGLAGLPGDAQSAAADVFGRLSGMDESERETFQSLRRSMRLGAPDLPNTTGVLAARESVVGGPLYQPQTKAGEYAQTIGEMVPNAVVPGGAGLKAASVLVPGVMSQAGGDLGQMVGGDTGEAVGRMAGGVSGGLGVGLVSALRGGPSRVIAGATEGVDPQALQLSAALRARGESLGVPLTNAEALQQATGGATNMGRVQRVVEGANSRLAPMMAARPEATSQAIGRVLEQIAPPVQPSQLAGQAQGAADEVLNTMRRRVGENAQPFYDRLPGQTLSPDDLTTLQANPSYAGAERELMGNPELAALVSGGPEDLSTVNRVLTQLDTMAEQARPGQMNPQGNNTLASQRSQAAALARQLASDTSPDFATARQTFATGMEAFVDPLKRGPIGAIAPQPELHPSLTQQTSALFPNSPFEGQAGETTQALRLLGEVDPNVGPGLVRQSLAQQASEAQQNLATGLNQFGGANFAARAFGNPEQRATMLGAIDTAAPQASRDTRDLIDVLMATGQRERPGSNTAFNQELQAQMAGGNVGQGVVRNTMNPLAIPGQVAQSFDDFIARRNAEKLAELLIADPETFASAIRRSARPRPGGNRIRTITALAAADNEE